MSEALAGIRVVEVCDRSAALAGRVLADLGAEVIMVEPSHGAAIRHDAPFLSQQRGPENSFAHLYFDTNKSSVVLDLDNTEQRAKFKRLIATTDVLLDSQRPGWFDERDLSHDALRTINPGLIQCSVTPFGLTTPWRHHKANDLVAGAAGGLIHVSGSPDGTPAQGASNPSYTMAGLAAASAITIALHQRDGGSADGDGAHIDLSLQEATALAVMQTATPGSWQWHRRIPRRPGLSSAIPCSDGKYVGLYVAPDRLPGFLKWADAEGIDHGMTLDDWRWARVDAPRQGNPVSETTLKLAGKLTRDEFVEGALAADIVCLPVLDFPDLEITEQYRMNDQFIDVHHPGLNKLLGYVRSPVDGIVDSVALCGAPMLGEHQHLIDDLPAPETTITPGKPIVVDPSTALNGLRVVDFGWVLAAPIGTRILASFGAEVIRIESSKKPDSVRTQPGPDGKPDPTMGGLFNVVNAGKKSLTVDLTVPEGIRVVKDLITTADVVVNNFRPGALERMGLGYDVLRELRPDIVLANLPGAHRVGPWARRPSFGNILMAASGFNMLTGFEEERPRGIGVAYPDFTAPHLLVATVLAALRHRRATGEGQELHLTQLSGLLSLLGAEWMQYKATGEQPPRNANRNPNWCPHGVYPTIPETDPNTDCWVALAVRGNDEWREFCALADHPEWANDPRFVDHAARKANEDALDDLVMQWTSTRDKWKISDLLQGVGIAAAPVEHLKDMLDTDPQLHRHYQQIRQPARPDVDIPVDREAARWVGAELDLKRAPVLGEHNKYVLQGILGRSDDEFADLVARSILT
ncbi:MAG: CoA transferase [Actinomycetia bacterium]|nr:CoA transferase [Actinomycetes bacterium]